VPESHSLGKTTVGRESDVFKSSECAGGRVPPLRVLSHANGWRVRGSASAAGRLCGALGGDWVAARGLTRLALAARIGIWTLLFRVVKRDDRYRVFLVTAPDGSLAHHSMVFPKYRRFPFMGANDLQVGDVWTAPRHRGRGLATFAMQEILRAAPQPHQVYWYVADEENAASIRVAEKNGFARAGWGRRTRPFRISLVGAFEMEN
jgi:GNAT superfamily N-acetyltransferase